MANVDDLFPDKPREVIQREQEDRENLLAGAGKIAMAIGVGYVGFKNYNSIRRNLSKTMAGANISLSRVTQSARFQGRVSEALNLSRAMDEVIDYSPSGMIRTLRRPNNTEEIFKRTQYHNRNTIDKLSRDKLSDVSESLSGLSRNYADEARNSTRIDIINQLFNEQADVVKRFGDKQDKAREIIRNNQKRLFNTQSLSGERDIDSDIYRLVKEYTGNESKVSSLTFKDEQDSESFLKAMIQTVDEVKMRTRSLETEWAQRGIKPVDVKKNTFGQYQELYKMAEFDAVESRHRLKRDQFTESMLENGFRPVTMAEARTHKVARRDGKTFMTATTGKKTVQDFYGSKYRDNNFVERFIEQGKKYGMDEKDLSSHIFSTDLYINEETKELVNIGSGKKTINDSLDWFERTFEIPFLRMNPVTFIPGRKTRDARNDLFKVLSGGRDFQPLVKQMDDYLLPDEVRNINANTNKINRSYLFSNGNIIDSDLAKNITGNNNVSRFEEFQKLRNEYTLDGDFSLHSARSGLTAQYAQTLSGRTNRENLADRNLFQKIFQLGGQENPSNIENLANYAKKFSDPYYSEHAIESLYQDAVEGDGTEFIAGLTQVRDSIYGKTKALDAEAQTALYDSLNEAMKTAGITIDGKTVNMFDIQDDNYAVDVLRAISERTNVGNKQPIEEVQRNIRSGLERKARNWVNYGIDVDEDDFFSNRRFQSDDRIFKPDKFFNRDEATEGIHRIDDVRMLIEQYAINQAEIDGINLTKGIYSNSYINQKNVANQLTNMKSLNEITHFLDEAKGIEFDRVRSSAEYFTQYYKDGSPEYTNLSATLSNIDSITNIPGGRKENLLGDTEFVAIRNERNLMREVHESLSKARHNPNTEDTAASIAQNLASDIIGGSLGKARSALAGPDGDVTTLTRDVWFFANRLDTSLQQLGLGLPNSKKGSAVSILGWQAASRVFGPMIAFEYAKYLDGLTDDKVSDTAAETYVNMRLDVASAKEFLGVNEMGRSLNRIFPWLEQAEDIPFVKAFNTITLGAFSETRTREELEEYYISGEDPIRKGRYWGIGSTSPWRGERIQYYKPNWYRRLKSDYMFSENVYGSEEEYWENHALPTPSNPFSTVRHFVTDPYHYEDKHAESRPYVMTGGFNSLRNIPLVGPAVDKAVSSVLKPTRINPRFKASHEELLRIQNEKLVSSYLGMNAGGIVRVTPSGISLHSDEYDVHLGSGTSSPHIDEDGFVDEASLVEDFENFSLSRNKYIASVAANVPLSEVYARGGMGDGQSSVYRKEPSKGFGKLLGKDEISINIREINQRLTDSRSAKYNDNPTQAGTLISPNQVRYRDDVINANAIVENQGLLKDIQYRASEMAGMYGFLSTTATGVSDNRSNPVLETSARFNNTTDKFWDMNLGGLGGDFSEIFRRYLPRDTNKYYNPISNTMPHWMPGDNYFIDFKRGDPFSKIPDGEMRLPSESYEKLYNVRKDVYGNYSAFDRYRILADVAPYSEEYRLAKKEVTLLNQNGLLDEGQKAEYAEIRKQVSSKNKRKEFYQERFEEIDLDRETVTVTQVIDQNNFLTEEYGNNPIRLAGVQVSKTDEYSMGILEQMIRPGQKLTIELDRNPQNRIRDDVYDTMRAVVYAPRNEEGVFSGLTGGLMQGENLNYYLSKQDGVSIKDDGSATSTQALFNDFERGLGRFGDWLVHDIMPTIPVLNTVQSIFMPVKSPVESYENEIFSKSWRSWENPVTGWIQPMLERTMSLNPAIAALHGAGIGGLSSSTNRWKGATIGAIIGGTIAGGRVIYELFNEQEAGNYDIWKPERRETEFEINEYFDRLTYLKYKGLYNQAVEKAKEEENVDLEEIFEIQNSRETTQREEYLNIRKKWLTIEQKSKRVPSEAIAEELDSIKEELSSFGNEEVLAEVGPYTALALRYKDAYESTLYAAGTGETYDYNKIYRALPYKDRPYFTEFIKASPKDRQRILELVPDNQRPIYQRYFGMDIEEVESMDSYFSERNLPDSNWEGWEAGQSLDNVKIKVMRNEGIDLTEANYWPEDEAIADQSGLDAVEIESSDLSTKIDTGELEKVLRGAGLENVSITLVSAESEKTTFNTNLNIVQDRTREVERGLFSFMQYM